VLGEDVRTRQDAERTAAAYSELLGGLATAGLADRAEVSIKLSALGLLLGAAAGLEAGGGEQIALRHARRLADAAARIGGSLTVDMEGHATTDATLRIVTELRREHPDVGAVLQSALFRSVDDCTHLSGPGSRVRLVKGAYAEPDSVAHPKKADVDRAYLRCLEILMAGEGYPMVATHDPAMIVAARRLAHRHGRTPQDWEVQFLHGIRPAEQRALAGIGLTVRVYVPFGTDWYGYYTRRLAERPANLFFLLRQLTH
jgi:proline dehydrogenase